MENINVNSIDTLDNDSLVKAYTNHVFNTFKGRSEIIREFSRNHPDNWQCVETPYDICREMVDLNILDPNADAYIVMFSLEFLEVLVKEHNFPVSQIGFLADNKMEQKLAFEMYGITNSVVLSQSDVCKDGKFDKSVVEKAMLQLMNG